MLFCREKSVFDLFCERIWLWGGGLGEASRKKLFIGEYHFYLIDILVDNKLQFRENEIYNTHGTV